MIFDIELSAGDTHQLQIIPSYHSILHMCEHGGSSEWVLGS